MRKLTPEDIEKMQAARRAKLRERGNLEGDFRHHYTTPVKAIRAFCVQCMGGYTSEIPICTDYHCPLYPYRMGKRPNKRKFKMIGLQQAIQIALSRY